MLERPVSLIGVPMDLGGGRRGVDMGPSALRIAGVEELVRSLRIGFEDLGNVPVPQLESREPRDPRARFLSEIQHACARLRDKVRLVLERERFPLVVGGDHSIACGTVAGIRMHHAERGQRIGLVWFDAHADMNTPETSPSGNVHGMPLSACLGRGPLELVGLAGSAPMVEPRNAVLIGVHSVDTSERAVILESGIRVFTMREVDRLGVHEVMRQAIAIATDGTAGFHLSFDLDGCDPSCAPGVGTPVRGGMDYRESHYVMEDAAASGALLGLELTEINPILDNRNATAEFAVELIASALGKRIL